MKAEFDEDDLVALPAQAREALVNLALRTAEREREAAGAEPERPDPWKLSRITRPKEASLGSGNTYRMPDLRSMK